MYQADIKTVDAFCTSLLRENTHLLAREGDSRALTPDFRVLDDSEAQLIRQRVLSRALEDFYDQLDQGGALLADTLGAGRDDSRLAALVLELYDKIQSHADPAGWLAENRTVWSGWEGGFDDTPYAEELLAALRRKGAHWRNLLRSAADGMTKDKALYQGYGTKFQQVSEAFAALAGAYTWEKARRAAEAIVFPRLSTPKGRKDEPGIIALKQMWERCKKETGKLEDLLSVTGEEAMEDLQAVAPAMVALLRLTEDFAERYRQEKLRLNAADFSDQEHLALGLLVGSDGTPTELGEQVAARYREILVDEYQDTNEIQNAIFQAVSRNGQNIFTVGDVKQSIYRFRLADPTIFLGKYNRFKPWQEAADGEGTEDPAVPQLPFPAGDPGEHQLHLLQHPVGGDGGDGLRRGRGAPLRGGILPGADGLPDGVPPDLCPPEGRGAGQAGEEAHGRGSVCCVAHPAAAGRGIPGHRGGRHPPPLPAGGHCDPDALPRQPVRRLCGRSGGAGHSLLLPGERRLLPYHGDLRHACPCWRSWTIPGRMCR